MRCGFFIFFLVFLFSFSSSRVFSSDSLPVVTIVHPVRGRSVWGNAEYFRRQIDLVRERGVPATWLLQYETLQDPDLRVLFSRIPPDHEIGIFLEIDETLATDSSVGYLQGDGDWARADKVLLSGYSPRERKRLITTAFEQFKKTFGFFPRSVGAWYIDTLSANFLSQTYGIDSLLEVSDQYETDRYGVWGKPWGTAYFPSRFNTMIPAQSDATALGVVSLQWAARDPVRGYGRTVDASTYSVQANDYSRHGLDTSYFRHLIAAYLFSPNPVAHLTVGLEVGQEGEKFRSEYVRQIDVLHSLSIQHLITFSTMSGFAETFRKHTHGRNLPSLLTFSDFLENQKEAYWYSSPFYRIFLLRDGKTLTVQDLRMYQDRLFSPDLFVADTRQELVRVLPAPIDAIFSDNALSLSDSVREISVAREGATDRLVVLDENGIRHVTFSPTEVRWDTQILYSSPSPQRISRLFHPSVDSLFLAYVLSSSSHFERSIRFSRIDGIWMGGIWIDPGHFVGISLSRPFFGRFFFPFQTLSRFHALPDVDPIGAFADYFLPHI